MFWERRVVEQLVRECSGFGLWGGGRFRSVVLGVGLSVSWPHTPRPRWQWSPFPFAGSLVCLVHHPRRSSFDFATHLENSSVPSSRGLFRSSHSVAPLMS